MKTLTQANAAELAVAGFTHDILGALSGITLRARAAAKELVAGDPAAALGSLERIHCIVAWVSDLCADLLECSRSRSGMTPPVMERIELSDCVRTCLEAQFAADERTKCALELDAPDSVWVFSQRLSIERVLVNIVRNAVRHGAGGKIRITVDSDSRHAGVTVRDAGQGIAPDLLARLTEPYERGDGLTTPFQNYGLGLWIVSTLVASLGGSLCICSELGVGTAVSFRLPLAA